MSDKGVFQRAQTHRERITVKLGSDLVIGSEGIQTSLLQSIALQALILNTEQTDLLIVTSGAVKYGRILAQKDAADHQLSKIEAAHKGFNPLMEAWRTTFEQVGLPAITLAITGQSLTKKNTAQVQHQIRSTPAISFIINTHDGLNSRRYKYADQAENNDLVGAHFATLLSSIYIICTNVDGVLDKNGKTIRQFQDLKQLNDITFYSEQNSNGTGGMETKLQAALCYSQSQAGRVAYIVNGREENVLRKVLKGEEVGTKVQLRTAKKEMELVKNETSKKYSRRDLTL